MNNTEKKVSINITLIATIISLAVSVIISFFITKYIVVNLGKESYSFYPIANNFTNYFTMIFLLLNGLSSRFVVKPYLKGDIEESHQYFSTIIISNVILSLIVALLEFIIYVNIDKLLNIPIYIFYDVKLLFLIIFISSIIRGLFSSFSIVYYVKNRMDIKAINTIISDSLKGLLLIVALYTNNLTIVFFGLTVLISTVSSVLIDIISYIKYMNDIKISFKYYSNDKLKIVFKSGVWQFISQSGYLLLTNLQLIISNMMLGATSSSILSLTQPLFTLCSLLVTTMNNVIDPLITKNIVIYNKDSSENILSLYYIYEFCSIIPLIMVLSFSNHFYNFWIPNENSSELYLLTILVIFETLICSISIVYDSILTTYFKMKEKGLMLIGSGLINIALMFIMVKNTNLGNVGILLSAIFVNVIYYVIFLPLYCKKILKKENKIININIYKNLFIYIMLMVIDIVFSYYLQVNSLFNFILICLIFVIIDYILLLLIRKINIKGIGNILKQIK